MMRRSRNLMIAMAAVLCLAGFEIGSVSRVFAGTEATGAATRTPGSPGTPPALAHLSTQTRAGVPGGRSAQTQGGDLDNPPAGTQATPLKTPDSGKSLKEKLNLRVSGSVVLQTIYDDNILRYSDGFIEDFRRNDPPDKFHVETYDDAILSPRLFLTFRANPLGKRETRLYLGYITWQYVRNPAKDNELWTLRLRQYTARYDRVEFSYSYSPPSYIRHLSDRVPFLPRSTTPLEWKPFKSVRHGLGLSYTHRMGRGLYGTVEGGRVLRFYNQPFMENDNREWNGAAEVLWNPPGIWRFIARYMYSDANARALDTVGETVATSDDGDGSYQRDLYELRTRLRPRHGLWLVKEFEISGQYMAYYFTGTKPAYEDPLHTGRKDDVYYLELTAGSKPILGGPVSLEFGYRYAQRTSSLPGTFEGEDAEDKDYKNNRAWFETRYSF
jgi:hypothetical protein